MDDRKMEFVIHYGCIVSSAKKITHHFTHNNITNVPIIFQNEVPRTIFYEVIGFGTTFFFSLVWLLLFGVTCYVSYMKKKICLKLI